MLIWVNIACALYLLWYAWVLFVRQKGDPGSLGLMVSVLAFMQLVSSIFFGD